MTFRMLVSSRRLSFFSVTVQSDERWYQIYLFLCETRWSEKYKSIRVFSHNFEKIFDCLADLEMTAAGETRQTAHVLLSACSSCTFLICIFIVANYSSVLEPVAQMLQSVQLDIVKAQQHISSLIDIINKRSK